VERRLPAHPLVKLILGEGREASIPGLAGNVLLLRPSRAQQGHSLALAFRRCAFTQGERIAFARIEVRLPGRTAGGRGDVRCLGGLAEVAEDA